MAYEYKEIPLNYDEISSLFISDAGLIIDTVLAARKILFYDTCSFRYHSALNEDTELTLCNYYCKHGFAIVIIRCILMELASKSGIVNKEHIAFLERLNTAGVTVVLLDEELLFDVLSECFSTCEVVNEYLSWAVRMSYSPVSTITGTLESHPKLRNSLISGRNLNQSGLYRDFFSAVRRNKTQDDNLGEQLIGICVHILSHMPGIADGCLCVMTDDKQGATEINTILIRTNKQFKGAKVVLFSSPKLAQYMYNEDQTIADVELIDIISHGTGDNVCVMGITKFDLEVNKHISMSPSELLEMIKEPNGISIAF